MRWTLPVSPRISGGGRGSLFGGAGLAAGVVALEQASGRPAVWVTGQYLAPTTSGTTIDLSVSLPANGRSVTQGRVIGTADGTEIIAILGATGRRDEILSGQWDSAPPTEDPEQGQLVVREPDQDSIHRFNEVRMMHGMFGFTGTGTPSGDNRSLLWVRIPGVPLDRAALALLGDYMPSNLGNAFGEISDCTSIDNTIRFASMLEPPADPTQDDEWVLCENELEFVGNGFGSGTTKMWGRDGRLLAIATQTMMIRASPS